MDLSRTPENEAKKKYENTNAQTVGASEGQAHSIQLYTFWEHIFGERQCFT